jgi:hypothetical protein
MSVTNRYYGFGLDFQSAIPIPEMREGSHGNDGPVAIQLANAPCPDGLIQVAEGVAAGPNDFWMDVPGIARLHVSHGAKILIDLAPGASLNELRAYLLGSATGALLHQRGFMPLHASAVEIDGQAIAFCGASGAGKSTLALNLVKRGHRLLSDDICAIDTSSGVPSIWPGLINLKLWRESLTAVGEGYEALQPVLPALDKYKLPIAETVGYHGHRVAHIFLLSVSERQQLAITHLQGTDGLAALVANTFRGQLVGPMKRDQRHFTQCVAIAASIKLHRLSYPWSLADIESTCQVIEATVRMS